MAKDEKDDRGRQEDTQSHIFWRVERDEDDDKNSRAVAALEAEGRSKMLCH